MLPCLGCRMQAIVRRLEVSLGPETGDLCMRFGLHSGPVTAGVLRGERTRFQLFGDTMNTASRMESTGKPGKIQMSHDTAELLKAAGKGGWLTPREEMVQAKGKGMMVTHWLTASTREGSSVAGDGSQIGSLTGSGDTPNSGDGNFNSSSDLNQYRVENNLQAKNNRLVQWNVEIFSNILRQIEASRDAETDEVAEISVSVPFTASRDGTVLDEVQKVIPLPEFVSEPARDPMSIVLNPKVVEQLRAFLSTVASLYQNNPFHNFEHASHVTMATVKLLSRVVNPKIDGVLPSEMDKASMLHDYTYGITSDPITQLACVFSAIIHDVDHAGVPNSTLIKENSKLAQVYKRSVAEQNSFDLAWNLFMDDQFSAFRYAVCRDSDELKRFRQIVVNMVMATDILDKELNGFRNMRWERAFESSSDLEESAKDKVDRKATIVIEHLIQASDVAHTMQHWHIYRKWNSRLFFEMYEAFLSGRSDTDPSKRWYEGELGFFDFYIIPLAKKLGECGVFGVASFEHLGYAERNRREWQDRGQQIVAEYIEEAKELYKRKMMEEPMPLTEEIESSEDGEIESRKN